MSRILKAILPNKKVNKSIPLPHHFLLQRDHQEITSYQTLAWIKTLLMLSTILEIKKRSMELGNQLEMVQVVL